MPLITLPTAERIRDIILSRILGSPGLSGADTAKGGFFWRLADAFARQGRSLLVRALGAQDQTLPDRATGDPLVAWADTVLGEGAAAATAWSGPIEIRCVNNTQTVPVNQAGTHEDGTAYKTTDQIDPVDWVSAGTYYYCRIAGTSTTLGTVANKAAGTEITLASPPAGVYSTAYLNPASGTETEGHDAETEAELQDRIVSRLRDMPGGGSPANYREWCREVTGVTDAFVYSRWDGVGAAGNNTVRCIIWGPPGARMLTATEVAAVNTHLADRDPVFVTSSTVALPVLAANPNRVSVTIRCAPGYEPDYDDSAYAPSVTAFDAPTRRIDLSLNPVGNLVPGNRIVVNCADLRSYQMTVQSVGAGFVIVDAAWVSNPRLLLVRAGGPLWAPVRTAVESVYDDLGPSASSTADKDRWPSGAREFPSTLYRSNLYERIEAVPGCTSSTITIPTADTSNSVAENVAPELLHLLGVGNDPDLIVLWGESV